MAAVTQGQPGRKSRIVGGERFFLIASAIMVVVVVAGFLTLLLRGISTFAAPWPVHVHAVLFMGWVGFFMMQVWFATTERVHLHRRFGWIAALYMPVLLIVGALILFRMMRSAAVPPFWTYSYFMVMNLMSLLAFAALTIAAIAWRKQTQWHRRLMFCAMAALVIASTPYVLRHGGPGDHARQSADAGCGPRAVHEPRVSACDPALSAVRHGGGLAASGETGASTPHGSGVSAP